MLGRSLVEAPPEADAEILGICKTGAVGYLGDGKAGVLKQLRSPLEAYIQDEFLD